MRRMTLAPDIDRVADGAGLWQHVDDDPQRHERRCTALRAAVSTVLTDKQREAVELFFFVGLSQGQIAARLNVSQQVVNKRIFGVVRGGRRIGGAIARLRAELMAGDV